MDRSTMCPIPYLWYRALRHGLLIRLYSNRLGYLLLPNLSIGGGLSNCACSQEPQCETAWASSTTTERTRLAKARFRSTPLTNFFDSIISGEMTTICHFPSQISYILICELTSRQSRSVLTNITSAVQPPCALLIAIASNENSSLKVVTWWVSFRFSTSSMDKI